MDNNRQVTWSGSTASGLMVIGESPWVDEVRLGRPFAGASGYLLDGQLRRAGLERDSVMVTNVLWTKPPYLGWVDHHPAAAIALSDNRHNWLELIDRVRPKCIVTLGAVAMREVLGVSNLDTRQAYIQDSPYGCPVIASYHPSYIMHGNHKLTQCLFFALMRAKEVVASGGSWQRKPVEYLIDPPVQEAAEYLWPLIRVSDRSAVYATTGEEVLLERYTTRLSTFLPTIPLLVVDIETPNSHKLDEDSYDDDPSYTIIRVSLSVGEQTALTLPWQEPYIGLVRRALASAAVVVAWNEGFDVPRLAASGCPINGEIHDAQWAWHWLQSDMLKSLGFVSPFYTDLPPWKHLSTAEPTYYSACDADATFRNYLGIRNDLERGGRWQRFVRHCLRVGEIFRRPNVGRVNVDGERQEVLRTRLVEEREAALARLQLDVPDAIKPRKVLKTKPKLDIEQYRELHSECLCQQQGTELVTGGEVLRDDDSR